jgi:hypothetical protein
MVLVSKNLNGNVHDAVEWVNANDLAQFVVQFVPVGPLSTIVILRMEERTFKSYDHSGIL